ncbi:hypothetical protein [Piscinibacter sp.]|uniref:hypothetical protein n=1 Tax=Piscinibacter sp. TaxID=1903157 RepID=UPI0039E49049
MPTPARFASLCFAALALAACAAEPAPAPAGMSVLVKLAQPGADAARVAAQVGEAAGRPARYLASSGGDWHSVFLRCDGAADCDALLQRLRADGARIAAVQRDERKRIVSP